MTEARRSVGAVVVLPRGASRARRYAASAAFVATGLSPACDTSGRRVSQTGATHVGFEGAAAGATASGSGVAGATGATSPGAGGVGATLPGAGGGAIIDPDIIVIPPDMPEPMPLPTQDEEPVFATDGGIVGQACEGFDNPPVESEPCRVWTDCALRPRDERVQCNVHRGAPQIGRSSGLSGLYCESDSDCSATLACHEDFDGRGRCYVSCAVPGQREQCTGNRYCDGDACLPKDCDQPDATQCRDGFECDPSSPLRDNIGCVPLSCAGGSYECWPTHDCAPTSETASPQGCAPRQCTADADCACGYCVNGACETTLGTCYHVPIAMPYGCVWPDEELV